MTPRQLRSATLAAVLVAAVGSAAARAGEDQLQQPRYELNVVVLPRGLSIEGELTWSGATPATLRFDLVRQMTATAVTLEGGELVVTRNRGELLVDVTKPPTGRERHRLTFTLTGSPRERFGRNRGGYLRSAIEPHVAYVRSQVPWYPRLPDVPAAYEVTLNVPAEWTAQTAGIAGEPKVEKDRAVWTFRADRPLRRLGLVAGPYRRVTAQTEGAFEIDALVIHCDDEAATHLLHVAARSHAYYRERFGKPAPQRFTLVEMPAAYGRASGYGEDGYLLIGKGAFQSAGDQPWADSLVAHEMAHTWFGSTVPFADFSSEALASFATLGFVEADQGADSARLLRRAAIDAVVTLSGDGRAIDLDEIRGFGGGMDPQIYRVHAYEKGMMILSMLGDHIGHEQLDARLTALLHGPRGIPLLWADLVHFLSAAGEDTTAAEFLAAWARAGAPELALEHTTQKSGATHVVSGRVAVRGETQPRPFRVTVAARTGDGWQEQETALREGAAVFEFRAKEAPSLVVVDRDSRVLAVRPSAGPEDPQVVLDRAFAVVGDPTASGRDALGRTVTSLRDLIDARATKHEGLCHMGIGRCLFRLGEHEAAATELRHALKLGPGGPFHARWAHLRLGCIADVRGDRDAAIAHYKRAARGRGSAPDLARKLLETPYRGYEKDG